MASSSRISRMSASSGVDKETLRVFVRLIAPVAPHIAEELWEKLGGTGSVFRSGWPVADEKLMQEDTVEIAVQMCGKVRATIAIKKDADKDMAIAQAKEALGDKLTGTIVKEIYVPGKIVNIVVK